MQKLALHLPINSVSFGQLSTLILRTAHDRELKGNTNIDWSLFTIGPVDLSSQAINQEFGTWLQGKILKSHETYSRDIPIFKLWHLNQSLESYSTKQTLLTFYELDNPTKIEMNIARNNKLCFSSKYSCDVFKIFGLETKFLPLAFDSYNFQTLTKKFHTDGRIVFNLCGKLERRKHHGKILQSWIKKFGNQNKYVLQCAVYNPHLNDQQNNELLRQIIGNDKPFNVTFLPPMKENIIYNDFLNSANIIIGMSGGEGWGLPEFHSVGLGKHAVLLNAHGYKSWAEKDMATFVQPNGKITSVDNIFFKQGEPFNQGNIFDWNEDEFITACESAIKKAEANPVNIEGLKLQTEYTKEKLLDNIIKLTLE